MVANQKIVAAINEQMGNEFSDFSFRRAGMKPIPRSVNLALAGLFKHPLKDILFLSGWPWNIMDRQQRSQ
jgi:hypothetical protein